MEVVRIRNNNPSPRFQPNWGSWFLLSVGEPGEARCRPGLALPWAPIRRERIYLSCSQEPRARAQKGGPLQDVWLGRVQTHRPGSGPAACAGGREPPGGPGGAGAESAAGRKAEKVRVCDRPVCTGCACKRRRRERSGSQRSDSWFTWPRDIREAAEDGGSDRAALAAGGEHSDTGREEGASFFQWALQRDGRARAAAGKL